MNGSSWSLCAPVLLALAPCVAAAEEGPTAAPRIPDREIDALRSKARRIGTDGSSRTEKRRDCKGLIRRGEALVDAHPASPDRFRVLGIVLQCQKTLLGLESTERNRRDLFDTCGKLVGAPDEYADLRLEADMLLSDRDLTAANATPDERAEALEEIVVRYRGTPAEAKSLMLASLIAQRLDALDLLKTIVDAMDERFADDPAMIAFRRDNLALRALPVKCHGRFTRADGATLYLPADRIGHHCVMVFWSGEKPGYETYLNQVEECRKRYRDLLEVYSLNVDELPDAGRKALRELGLDWTAMHLPGGNKSEVYRAYATRDPVALVFNAYGYTILAPMHAPSDSSVGVRGLHSSAFTIDDSRISHERYLAQLQSLFIGDFLVMDPEHAFDPSRPPELRMVPADGREGPDTRLVRPAESVPAETLKEIQGCFVAPPFRYRLMRGEALANYEKAERLCADAIGRLPEAPDLWLVRNRRIVALLGLWNLTCEPGYLERATEEARATLAMDLPRGADVVARFCLAKSALRCDEPDPESVLPGFIEATGGDRAPASAVAAATILALDANSKELHDRYRGRLLESPGDGNALLWPVRTFLCNRYHQFYLLRPNYTRGDQVAWPRSHIVNHGGSPDIKRLPELELGTLDGATLKFPREAEDKLTLLVFIEPPADPDADFPVVLDRQGKPTTNDHVRRVMEYASTLAGSHVNGDVDLVAAFLCDDTGRVDALMKKNGWTCRVAMVPGGLGNPIVRRLGILSADRVPNVFLVRRDGTVAWHASGLEYKSEFGYPFAFLLAMKVQIEVCEVEHAHEALLQGNYEEAARVFAGPFPPADPDRYGWRAPRYHGKALAHAGLRDWDGALVAIDMAIAAHKLHHHPHKRGRDPGTWQQDVAGVAVDEPCDVFAELWVTKAMILEHLGRGEEAAALRRRAAAPARPDEESPYSLFHGKLKEFRLGHQ